MSVYCKLTPFLHARVADHVTIYTIWCPGCGEPHGFPVRNDPNEKVDPGALSWNFNNNLAAPSFTPSLLHQHPPRCHLTLTDGKIHFAPDCDHELKGKIVDMVPREGG